MPAIKTIIRSFAVFLILAGCAPAFAVPGKNPVYEFLRVEIEKQASAALGREVSIGAVSGNLVTSVTLRDVAIARGKKISDGKIIHVRRARVGYNAIRGAVARDMLQALTSIHLEGPDVYVEHGADGSWNFEKLIPMEEGAPGPIPVFRARISVADGRALFVDKKGFAAPLSSDFEMSVKQIDGAANFSRTDRISFRFSGRTQEGPIKVDGTFFFSDMRTDLKLVAEDILLDRWNPYLAIPVAKDIPMSGNADADLYMSTVPQLKLRSSIVLKKALLYGRPAKGGISINLDKKGLDLSLQKAQFCSGGISGTITADLSRKNALISGTFDLSGTDLHQASQVPGIYGRASGRLGIGGPVSALKLSGRLSFDKGEAFGQEIEGLSAAASIDQGEIAIDNIRLYAGQRSAVLSGRVGRDKSFVFESSISGFELRNSDILSGVNVLVESFQGKVSGRFDEPTMQHPLKNIEADGMLLLSSGRIGSQRIRRAQGRVKLSRGVFESEGFSVVLESSGLLISGSIGIDHRSDLSIIGRNMDLSDLKIIDDLLPEGAKGVSGTGDLIVAVGGYVTESPELYRAISTLDISLEAAAINSSIGIKSIKSARLAARWESGALEIRDLHIETPDSMLRASGRMDTREGLSGIYEGDIFLSDLAPVIQRYAKLLGRLSFKGVLSGTVREPVASMRFSAQDINFNNIKFDLMSGEAGYKSGAFYLEDPSVLIYGGDSYNLFGNISPGTSGPAYSGGIYTDKGNLSSLLAMGNALYQEYSKRTHQHQEVPDPPLYVPDVKKSMDASGKYILFGSKNGFLREWQEAVSKKQAEDTEGPFWTNLTAEAPLGLRAEFSGTPDKLALSASFNISAGRISSYAFDSIRGAVSLDGSALVLDNVSVQKRLGSLSVHGQADLAGPLDLKISSENFDVAGLDSALAFPVQIEGLADLNASLSGTFSDPEINCKFTARNAGVANIFLDQVEGHLKLGSGQLEIDRLIMTAKGQVASMEGVIPFVKDKEIALDLNLNGENVGLLASLIKGVRWDSGSGSAMIKASGTIDRPRIDGFLSVQNAVVDIDQLKTSAYNFDADILFDGHRMTVNKFSGVFSGDRTGLKPLPFSAAGYMDFSESFGHAKRTDIDLRIADTSGYIDIPEIYSGEFSISGSSLKGPLVLPGGASAGRNMIVRSSISLREGSVFLPKGGGADIPKPNIEFDVSAAIGKNVRLVQGAGGQALSMDLANMNLEIYGEELLLTGTMSAPVVNGNVQIKSGNLSILGREFIIVGEYDQEKYFGSDRSSIIANEAVFYGGEKPYSAMPYIRLTAKSEIISFTRSKTEDRSVHKDTTMVITRISGMPFVQEQSRMIALSFYAFKLDNEKSPPELVPADYDQNRIRLMLLPDFLKSGLGVSEGDVDDGIDANAIIVDYLNARLQSYLLRGITSRVEQALGLESFTLDYNFGRDLEKILPTKRGEYGVNDTPQFGVGFVKGVFDNVFIQVRYAQALEQSSFISNMSLNYQITWKATRYYSFVYYREPVTFQEQDSTYYKMTLQSQYSF